ncbi:hypothetical protein [uncultured Sutterella sp.]|uniref:hypothetical protein n=1 Tax=uncultured Sutterella sp. TaxID=286133 RepID=UPI00266D61DD|nr:hypothetical protein [uncultured Sutterella sp.]
MGDANELPTEERREERHAGRDQKDEPAFEAWIKPEKQVLAPYVSFSGELHQKTDRSLQFNRADDFAADVFAGVRNQAELPSDSDRTKAEIDIAGPASSGNIDAHESWILPGRQRYLKTNVRAQPEKKDGRNGGKNTEHGIHSSKELEKRLHFSSGGWLMDVLARTPSIIPRGSQQE